MNVTRRNFLASATAAAATAVVGARSARAAQPLATRFPTTTDDALYAAAARPVLE